MIASDLDGVQIAPTGHHHEPNVVVDGSDLLQQVEPCHVRHVPVANDHVDSQPHLAEKVERLPAVFGGENLDRKSTRLNSSH